jgi:hypothetical protein
MLLAHTREMLEAQPDCEDAWRNFYIAEGSDWMWWYGDTHSSAQDEEFDRLFRAHLGNAYRLLGQPPPQELQQPIKQTRPLRAGTEPTAAISPRIDGLETTYYEWLYAGRVDLRKDYAAMHRSGQRLQALWYGFDLAHSYLRVDLLGQEGAAQAGARAHTEVHIEIPEHHLTLGVRLEAPGTTQAVLNGARAPAIRCAYQRVLEIAIPYTILRPQPGAPFHVAVSLHEEERLLERYPAHGTFQLSVPAPDDEARAWSV